ncbi:MAG: thioredoxin domain-containing protein, partial [Planctomycetia bacterium]|nr:thioredoxin domain-containing protein [Planctomycetia bacterium]
MTASSAPTNRLLHESSPYLKQHAHNPVDWYPWGPEALQRARDLDRPIFLSVGYSACHWCHVMEHESFENAEIGRILNEHFVSIKVDREERPDIDQIYMAAVQLLTRQGGWPMSVFLAPDLKPFYGGTYYPPDDRYGRPGFKRLLLAIADAWQHRRPELIEQAGQIAQGIQESLQVPAGVGDLTPVLLQNAGRQLSRAFDAVHGGFGGAPKFPHAVELRLLLRLWQRFQDDQALDMVRLTLDKMALGGMYDHLGGGFHRYSTDERWLAPHFEKMLYDNALLSQAYLEAYQATGAPFYRRIVEETLDYVLREMTSPAGAFYSTQDADSEGEEGKFYVWTQAEIEQVIGPEAAQVFNAVYDVTPQGNWEGHTILFRHRHDEQEAKLLKLDVEELRRRLADARQKLLDVRGQRVWPGRDEKILTSWNGLMITSFAEAAAVLEQPRYAEAASKATDFVLTKMRGPNGRLLRIASAGGEAKLNAYLEDYAYLGNALVSLYEATFQPRWLSEALKLADVMLEQFWDAAEGGFFFTSQDHEALIARVKDVHDHSTPSGNSMAVTMLLRLAKLTGRADLQEKAEQTLRFARVLMERSSMAAGQMLLALDFLLGPTQEFAVVGDPDHDETRRVLRTIRGRFRPNRVVALKTPGSEDRVVGLLRD